MHARAIADAAALHLRSMLGEAPTGTVELNLTAIDRAWPSGGARYSAHPLVRKRNANAAPAAAAAAAAAATFVFEAIWPGMGNLWKQIAVFAEPSGVLSVPLQAGCALVRARRVAGA
jgi:hypothetical protein